MIRRVRVGDVLRLERRAVEIDPFREYTLIGVYSFGKGIFHRDPQLGSELGNYRFFEVMPGDLVLSNIQAWEGAIAFATEKDKGCIGTHRFLSYVPVDGRVDTNYLHYYFLSESGHALIRQAAPGSVTRNRTLSIDRFENLEIPLPDLDEQRRVVARLEAASRNLERLTAQQRRAQTSSTALMGSALGKLFGELDTAAVPLGNLAEVVRGKGPRYLPDTGSLVVNQACVRWNGVDLAQAKEADPAWVAELSDDTLIRDRDVLVNSTGEGTIGRACVATSKLEGIPFDSHILSVRVDAQRLLPAYLTLFLRSPQGQDAITNLKSATTTQQTELGKAKLESIKIPLPDETRQREIASRFDRVSELVDRLVAAQSSSRVLVAALGSSILNRAFAGSL